MYSEFTINLQPSYINKTCIYVSHQIVVTTFPAFSLWKAAEWVAQLTHRLNLPRSPLLGVYSRSLPSLSGYLVPNTVSIFRQLFTAIRPVGMGARCPSGLERWTGDRVVHGWNPAAAT